MNRKALLLLMIGIVSFLFFQYKKKYDAALENRLQKKVESTLPLNQESGSLNKPQVGSVSKVEAKIECNEKVSLDEIDLREERAIDLFRKKQQFSEPVFVKNGCPVAESRIQVYTVHTDQGVPYSKTLRGTARIVKFHKVKLSEFYISNKTIKGEDRLYWSYLENKISRGKFGLNEEIAVVDVELDQPLVHQVSYGVPLIHPRATVLNSLSEVAKLQNEGVPFVDLSRPNKFQQNKFAGAINFPLVEQPLPLRGLILPPSEIPYWLRIERGVGLPAPVKGKIIVTSGCASNFSAYNFATYLLNFGYSDVYIYRHDGRECSAFPKGVKASVRIVTAEELLDLRKKGAILLDVRNKMPVIKSYIRGSVRNEIIIYKRKFIFNSKPNFPKEKMIVVYGYNEFDRRIAGAIRVLSKRGYSNIGVYMFGIQDWMNNNFFDPIQFPVDPL